MKNNKKIYYYFLNDKIQSFNNTSALKNHLRMKFSLNIYYCLTYHSLKEIEKKIEDNFIKNPIYVYEYDTSTKKEIAYQVLIKCEKDNNYYNNKMELVSINDNKSD